MKTIQFVSFFDGSHAAFKIMNDQDFSKWTLTNKSVHLTDWFKNRTISDKIKSKKTYLANLRPNIRSWLNSPCRRGKTGYLNIVVISAILIPNVFSRKSYENSLFCSSVCCRASEVLCPAQLSATELVGDQSWFYSYALSPSLPPSAPSLPHLFPPTHFQYTSQGEEEFIINLWIFLLVTVKNFVMFFKISSVI